jgi:hypothetical protein
MLIDAHLVSDHKKPHGQYHAVYIAYRLTTRVIARNIQGIIPPSHSSFSPLDRERCKHTLKHKKQNVFVIHSQLILLFLL